MPECLKIYDNTEKKWVGDVIRTTPPQVIYADNEAHAHCYTQAEWDELVALLNIGQPAGRFGRPKDRQH